MAIRATMHQAGAAGLTQLLTEEPPQQRHLSCPCGGTADYEELRSKPVLTAVGPARMLRPYYLCSRCHEGQFPTDQVLDVERTEFSPGVRRMLGVVGSECSSFRLGAEQMLLLAGLEVTAKAVERVAEAIGADLAAREQAEIQKAMQLELPVAAGPSISVLYVELDGTGVPVVPKETEGHKGRQEGQPAHTREAKMGCIFSQTMVDEEGYALRDEASTTYLGGIQTAGEFGPRPLHGSLSTRLEPRPPPSGPGRRPALQLEHRAGAFPGSRSDCRSVSRSRTSVGTGSQTVSLRPGGQTGLDQGPPALAR